MEITDNGEQNFYYFLCYFWLLWIFQILMLYLKIKIINVAVSTNLEKGIGDNKLIILLTFNVELLIKILFELYVICIMLMKLKHINIF